MKELFNDARVYQSGERKMKIRLSVEVEGMTKETEGDIFRILSDYFDDELCPKDVNILEELEHEVDIV